MLSITAHTVTSRADNQRADELITNDAIRLQNLQYVVSDNDIHETGTMFRTIGSIWGEGERGEIRQIVLIYRNRPDI